MVGITGCGRKAVEVIKDMEAATRAAIRAVTEAEVEAVTSKATKVITSRDRPTICGRRPSDTVDTNNRGAVMATEAKCNHLIR